MEARPSPVLHYKEVGKGTGLGLSQVFGFAKQSGGEVNVQSSFGTGTTFTIYLPRTYADASATTTDVSSAVPLVGEGHVLVVDDNKMVGEFAAQLLEELGYATTWAHSGQATLDLLNKAHDSFNIVFTDVVMPGMSGVTLGQAVRCLDPSLPVVLTSGYSHILTEKGTHGFELLRKPYSVEGLSRVLRRVSRM